MPLPEIEMKYYAVELTADDDGETSQMLVLSPSAEAADEYVSTYARAHGHKQTRAAAHVPDIEAWTKAGNKSLDSISRRRLAAADKAAQAAAKGGQL